MKPGTNCIFNYSGSGWHPIQKFNGTKVKILRQLGPDETDEENEMYVVKAEDGSEFNVFVDELTEIIKIEKAAPFTLWQLNSWLNISADISIKDCTDQIFNPESINAVKEVVYAISEDEK